MAGIKKLNEEDGMSRVLLTGLPLPSGKMRNYERLVPRKKAHEALLAMFCQWKRERMEGRNVLLRMSI